jgi:uncharacterized protein YecE (DUF72 family)
VAPGDGYLRLHAGARYRYGLRAIDSWLRRALAYPTGEDFFAYFNNDQGAAAVHDAAAMVAHAKRIGLTVNCTGEAG